MTEENPESLEEARKDIKKIETEKANLAEVEPEEITEEHKLTMNELDKEISEVKEENLEKMQGPMMRGAVTKEEKEDAPEEIEEEKIISEIETHIFALRTTANREDQVMDFVGSNVSKKKLGVYSIIKPHGMRGYIFVEAGSRADAEQAAYNVPYARGILPNEIHYHEIENMLEQVKKEINMKKNDIAEIISGPFKREQCKITRIDQAKEEVVVELLESAVPIPITLKTDALKVIRREDNESEN